jgi:predicted TIM-barrel fold metal-dependent hydrolase
MTRHRGAEIRAGLDHPVIDADGHGIEFIPLVRDLLEGISDRSVAERFEEQISSARTVWRLRPAQRRAFGSMRASWWILPARNTLDRATAMLPALLASRLDDLGIDHAVLYPTYGLMVAPLDDAELRCALARAFNLYYAEAFAEHGNRLTPVGVIPIHTPEEALAELDFATGELGLKAFTFGAPVSRPMLGAEGPGGGRWVDNLAIDSRYDYDPVWERCVELGVSPTFHTSSIGWHTHGSVSNYVYNHLGMFGTASEVMCRALVLGGVCSRFPSLRFGFQEGGVGWGAALFVNLVGHWEKRNGSAIEHYNPANLDRTLLSNLFAEHGSEAFNQRTHRMDEALDYLSFPDEPLGGRDEFAASGVTSAADLTRIFSEQLFFGCEADDPMAAVAFDRRKGLLGATLQPLFASDIGHWDVRDIEDVLPEAWELVEHGHLVEDEFRDFTYANAVRLWASTNPAFFDGTSVAGAERLVDRVGRHPA